LGRCQVCDGEVLLPFRCSYCGGSFCAEHRLPEMHRCYGIRLAPSPDRIRVAERYRFSPASRQRAFSISRSEVYHLVAASALVALAGLGLTGWALREIQVLAILLTGFVASFLGHEIMHKLVSVKRGFYALFRIYPAGAFVTLITAVLPIPFKVIMPGAVVFSGPAGPRDVGLISLAGPVFNLSLASVLLGINLVTGYWVLEAIAELNLFLAFFNLLPIPPLDGEKVFRWSAKVWAAAFVSALALMLLARLL
jgi:Zn-dependent protease